MQCRLSFMICSYVNSRMVLFLFYTSFLTCRETFLFSINLSRSLDKNWVHFFLVSYIHKSGSFLQRSFFNLDHLSMRESSFFIGNRFPRSPQTRRHISVMQLFCQSHNFSIDFLKLLSPHTIPRECRDPKII